MSMAAVRRERAYGITRSYGNIRNWFSAQYADEERANPGELARLRAAQGGGGFGRGTGGS